MIQAPHGTKICANSADDYGVVVVVVVVVAVVVVVLVDGVDGEEPLSLLFDKASTPSAITAPAPRSQYNGTLSSD
jgi:hypothetical protein